MRKRQVFGARQAARATMLVAIAVPLAVLATRAQAALVIAWSPTSNVTCAHHICTATSGDAVLSMSKLKSLIQTGNVKIVSGSGAGDIEVNAAVSWPGANTLTLDSYHSIVFEAPFTVAGTGGLVLTTNDGGTAGLLHFAQTGNVTFWSTANALTIDGHAYTLVSDIATLAADVAATPGGYYALANSYNAQPDGTYAHSPVTTALTGTFEGLGNTISNLTINDTNSGDGVGLFAAISSTGTVGDIGLSNANVSGTGGGGALAGSSGGTLRYVFATGIVSFGEGAGGLVSGNEGTIEFSHSSVTVTSGGFIGGLVGNNYGNIVQSYATGSVSGSFAGGLVGQNSGTLISQCFASGPVSGEEVGGLIGKNDTGTVTQTYETGSVTGSVSQGGLIGNNAGVHATTITYSYWDTTTTGMTGKRNGAGINNTGITPLSSKNLKAALPAGFDSTIWGQNAAINGGFPYLLAIPPT